MSRCSDHDFQVLPQIIPLPHTVLPRLQVMSPIYIVIPLRGLPEFDPKLEVLTMTGSPLVYNLKVVQMNATSRPSERRSWLLPSLSALLVLRQRCSGTNTSPQSRLAC
jgi:hypothetical protein